MNRESNTSEQTQEVHHFIKHCHHYILNPAQILHRLYGGSVKSENEELIQQADIDGALIGGACLDVQSLKIS